MEEHPSGHEGAQTPPHARPRVAHWVVTAAALAAVVTSVLLAAPAQRARGLPAPPELYGTTADSDRESHPSGPDPAEAVYPLHCAGAPVQIVKQVSTDLDGDGRPETVAAAHCRAGSGTPPHALYVLSSGVTPKATPRIIATLVSEREAMNVTDLQVRDGRLTARLIGYSSPEVPRCCPDRKDTRAWEWNTGRFVAVPQAFTI